MRLLFSIFILFIINSCGPIYSSRNLYIPPEDYEGRVCINNCLSNKNYCQHGCDHIEQNCKNNASLLDIGNKVIDLLKEDKNSTDKIINNSSTDQANAEVSRCRRQNEICKAGCNSNYDLCYQNCGGIIHIERYCSMFCT